MYVARTIAEIRGALDFQRADGATVGFVPTMGALHDGHMSLVSAARDGNDIVAVSIFVNPLQFDSDSDLENYPASLDSDLGQCGSAGVDIVFTPTASEMYPEPLATTVSLSELADRWEGATRRSHFDGVATVVTKLFSIAGNCTAYFGEKDFQQLKIVTRLGRDLSMPVRIQGCPTIREDDRVAMSSRNVRLTEQDRAEAVAVPTALAAAQELFVSGERSSSRLNDAMVEVISASSSGELDYAASVDSTTLEPVDVVDNTTRLLIAVQFGEIRLIDNASVLGFSPSALETR